MGSRGVGSGKGDQPDPELVASVGYLMRTTAVYGSGKFGVADQKFSLTMRMQRTLSDRNVDRIPDPDFCDGPC